MIECIDNTFKVVSCVLKYVPSIKLVMATMHILYRQEGQEKNDCF